MEEEKEEGYLFDAMVLLRQRDLEQREREIITYVRTYVLVSFFFGYL